LCYRKDIFVRAAIAVRVDEEDSMATGLAMSHMREGLGALFMVEEWKSKRCM
jgi:hypothetical protein